MQGKTIGSQSFSDALTSSQPIANLNVQDLTYYWLAGNLLEVSGTATLGGTQQTVYAVYNVEAPTAVNIVPTFATPGIAPSPQPFLELGDASNVAANPGILLRLSATAPKDFGGYFAETQLVSSGPVATPASPPPFQSTNGAFWSDNCAFYMVDSTLAVFNPIAEGAGNSAAFSTYDAPQYPLATLQSLAINDHFKDYMIFRPSGPNNAFVAIDELDWSWGGTATLSGGAYTLASPILPSNTSSGGVGGAISWPNKYPSEGNCPSIPSS